MKTTTKPAPSAEALTSRFTLARTLAEEAGDMALDYFRRRSELEIEAKRGMQDVVSIADRNVETFIRQRLEEAFPEDGILGEEHGLQQGISGFTWAVDPIDGTNAFVNGLPYWCVSIALLEKGEPVIGVIRLPCDGETFAALDGAGATLNGEPLHLDPARTLQTGLTGIGANNKVPPAMIGNLIAGLLEAGGNYVRTGSAAQMLAFVAAGRVTGFFEPELNAWDCLAGYCLVKEAGGFCRPFPAEGDALLKPAPVLAAGPGAFGELSELTEACLSARYD